MRFDVTKLKNADPNAKNIFRITPPYYLLNREDESDIAEKKKVIFLGGCFKNLPRDINFPEYLKITNQCLDYVRRQCAGYELFYKPHPAETDEFKLLNLESFKMEKDKAPSEAFFCNNLNKIKYAFSSHSWASKSAHGLGLNSYVFIKLFKPAFGEFTKTGLQEYNGGMPESYFISDLNQNLEENKTKFVKDDFLIKHLSELLSKNNGKVWLMDCGDPSFLPTIISFSRVIKSISPCRKVGLIITRHERWDLINIEDIKSDFDDIRFFPRVIASVRPSRLLDLLKTVWAAKKFPINKGDIFIGVGPGSFIENCLISYNKNNLRIALIIEKTFELNHNFKTPLKSSDYSIKWTVWIFNKIIQPLLGLYQAVGRLQRRGDRGGFGITRYQRPINEVFDFVYVLKPANKIEGPICENIWS